MFPRVSVDLEEVLEPYQLAFESAPIGMAFISRDWALIECNSALCAILGRSEEDLRQHSATEFTHPDDRHLHQPHHQQLMDGEIASYDLEGRYVHGDGHVGWVSMHFGAVRDARGRPRMVIALVEEITEQRWIRDLQERLLDLVLVGRGASALVEALAVVMESPVALLDQNGQPLAAESHAGRQIANLRSEDLESGSQPGILVRPLRLGEHVEGYLIAEDISSARPVISRAFEQAAWAATLQLAITRSVEEADQRFHGNFIDALLSETPPDAAALARWATRLGRDLANLNMAMVTRPTDHGRFVAPEQLARLGRSVATITNRLAPGSLSATRDSRVLTALPVTELDDARRLARTVINELRADPDITVGLSRLLGGPDSLRAAFDDARQAADAATALPQLGPVAAFEDLHLRHVLLGGTPRADLLRAARQSLFPLIGPSPPRNADALLETLATYLDALGGLEATARRLDIHVTTLRQRIERIETVLGVDLRLPQTRLDLQLAIELLGLTPTG
jgi:PAS domain S-box-containing protein